MPIKIADMLNGRRTFVMETEFGPLRISYRPYEMTPARESAIARLADRTEDDYSQEGDRVSKTEAGNLQVIEQFCTVVEAWDFIGPLSDPVTNKVIVPEGEPVLVTPENMRYVSSYFMIKCLNAIGEDARPKKGQQSGPRDT